MKKLALYSTVILAIIMVARTTTSRRHPQKKSKAKQHSSRSHSTEAKRASTEKELRKLQQEIARYESELKEHEKREKHSKETIQAFEKRQKQLKFTIQKLEREETDLEGQKSEVDQNLAKTSETLESRKAAYARSTRELYEQSALEPLNPDLVMLESPQTDPTRISYYAGVIARAHAMDRSRLDSMKSALGETSASLETNIENESAQIGTHEEEANSIEQKKAQEAQTLSQIQAKKERLKKLLAERKASEKRLRSIIANLITKESAPRRGKKHNRKSSENEEPLFLGPARGPHSLEWPTSSHHVVQAFGEHRNPDLGTVTVNLGIDISAQPGSSVRAAAEGEVALVSSLPSYGTVVVLRHAGNLHTVYANLSSALVSVGTHVRPGETIAKSGTSEMTGASLHFEVWKGKADQNPSGWLK